MIVTRHEDKNEILLMLEGRLDTNSAPELEKELAECSMDSGKLIFDFAKLRYISSAGLRVLLSTQKQMNAAQGTMIIRHPNELVMEVFDVTGFSDIMTIER